MPCTSRLAAKCSAGLLGQKLALRAALHAPVWLPVHRTQPGRAAHHCTLHAGFEGVERVPSMFVLLGNFQSYACSSASTDYAAVGDNFSALASLLAAFPRIMARACPALVLPCGAASHHESCGRHCRLCTLMTGNDGAKRRMWAAVGWSMVRSVDA